MIPLTAIDSRRNKRYPNDDSYASEMLLEHTPARSDGFNQHLTLVSTNEAPRPARQAGGLQPHMDGATCFCVDVLK